MKGQVTIFIILMILVLFVFGFMFYALNMSAKKNTQQQSQITIEEIIAETNVDQTIKSCLDESVTEGLRVIAKQGGYLYKNQNYTSKRGNEIQVGRDTDLNPVGKTINYNGNNYTVLITTPILENYSEKTNSDYENQPNPAHFIPPLYPCLSLYNSAYGMDTKIQTNLSVPGENCLRKYTLDYPIPGFSDTSSFKLCGRNSTGVGGCSCSRNCNDSIQLALEHFVEKTFPDCFANINFTGYDVDLSNFTLFSDFSGRSIDFSITPELTVFSKDQVFSSELPQVRSRRFAIKLKSIIETLNFILTDEAQIPIFNFTKGFEDAQSNLQLAARIQNPVVNYIHDIEFNGKYYHIYQVVLDGEDGTLAGQPFKFEFAVENRIPVLQYVLSTNFDNEPGTVKVCAVDPDEDFTIITITGLPPGWTETKKSCPNERNCICFDYSSLSLDTAYNSVNPLVKIEDGVSTRLGRDYSDYQTFTINVK